MKRLLLILGGIALLFYWMGRQPVEVPPGQLAPSIPVQRDLHAAPALTHNGYALTALADFEIEARVLATERYRIGREAELSPVDLALGWGPMSDSEVLRHISIRQSNRFYYWRVEQFPIPRRDIETHSANMHMIPADEGVRDTLLDARPGQIVRIQGRLVRADADDGWHWVSSLTRNDTGNGACELVYVEHAELR